MRSSHSHLRRAAWAGVYILAGILGFIAGQCAPTPSALGSRPPRTSEPLLLPHERLVVINIEGNTLSGTISVSDVNNVIKRCVAMYQELRATMKRSELPRIELYTLRAIKRDGTYSVVIDRHELISSPSQRSPTARGSIPTS